MQQAAVFQDDQRRESAFFELLDIVSEQGHLNPQADAFLAQHAGIGIGVLQIGLQPDLVLFQVHQPGLVFVVVFHIEIDAAFADIRVEFRDLFAKGFVVVHDIPPWMAATSEKDFLVDPGPYKTLVDDERGVPDHRWFIRTRFFMARV
jgi:hypothetical protein